MVTLIVMCFHGDVMITMKHREGSCFGGKKNRCIKYAFETFLGCFAQGTFYIDKLILMDNKKRHFPQENVCYRE